MSISTFIHLLLRFISQININIYIHPLVIAVISGCLEFLFDSQFVTIILNTCSKKKKKIWNKDIDKLDD